MSLLAFDELDLSLAAPFELRMRARPENLALARLALAGVAGLAWAPEEVVADLKLAVTEACTNAIQHAYREGDGDEEIVVRYRAGGGVLSVEVDDGGGGFSGASEDAGDPELVSGSGLGLMIIRELTDDLRIETGPAGSRVCFLRRFRPER